MNEELRDLAKTVRHVSQLHRTITQKITADPHNLGEEGAALLESSLMLQRAAATFLDRNLRVETDSGADDIIRALIQQHAAESVMSGVALRLGVKKELDYNATDIGRISKDLQERLDMVVTKNDMGQALLNWAVPRVKKGIGRKVAEWYSRFLKEEASLGHCTVCGTLIKRLTRKEGKLVPACLCTQRPLLTEGQGGLCTCGHWESWHTTACTGRAISDSLRACACATFNRARILKIHEHSRGKDHCPACIAQSEEAAVLGNEDTIDTTFEKIQNLS